MSRRAFLSNEFNASGKFGRIAFALLLLCCAMLAPASFARKSAPPADGEIKQAELHSGDLFVDSCQTEGRKYTIFKGYKDSQLPFEFCAVRPEKSDQQLVLCVAAAFTSPEQKIDGIAIANGKRVGGAINKKLGGAAIIRDGALCIFPGGAKVLTDSFVSDVEKDKLSLFQQFQLVANGVPSTFKDQSQFQRRALIILQNGCQAVVESQGKITLAQFAKDLQALSVRDALYTDMGGWDEGWYRIGGDTKKIGHYLSDTRKQTNWIVLRKAGAGSREVDSRSASKWLAEHLPNK